MNILMKKFQISLRRAAPRENLQGLGANLEVDAPNENDNEYDIYRKRMMLAYRFRPNPLVSIKLTRMSPV